MEESKHPLPDAPPPSYDISVSGNHGYYPTQAPGSYPPPQGYQSYPTPVANHPQQPGYSYNNVVVQPTPMNNVVIAPVNNNMALAIFATLCCFWPLGLVAIVKASEVNTALRRNDLARAQELAAQSKRYSLISLGVGAVIIVATVIVSVILVLHA